MSYLIKTILAFLLAGAVMIALWGSGAFSWFYGQTTIGQIQRLQDRVELLERRVDFLEKHPINNP